MCFLFVIQVTCWWLYYTTVCPVVGAPSHIILIGTGSSASVHQRKLSPMVSLLNKVQWIRCSSILSSETLLFILWLCFSLLMCFSFCPHVAWSHRSVSGESMSEWRRLHVDPAQTLVCVLLSGKLHRETLWAEYVDLYLSFFYKCQVEHLFLCIFSIQSSLILLIWCCQILVASLFSLVVSYHICTWRCLLSITWQPREETEVLGLISFTLFLNMMKKNWNSRLLNKAWSRVIFIFCPLYVWKAVL